MATDATPAAVRAGILKAFLATAAYAGLHTGLATETAKAWAERAVGTRARNAFYRPMFNAVAVTATVALARYLWRLPDRRLYRVGGPAAGLMRAGQAASLAYLGWAAVSQDVPGFLGLTQLLAYARGKRTVPREPAAQGPSLDTATGRIRAAGPFARARQPANVAFVPMLWLNPTMTAKLATVAAAVTAYSLVGSVHAERLLRDAYGPAWADYRRTGVPMFIPVPGRRATA